MIRRLFWLVLVVLGVLAPAGCGGEKDRGKNTDKNSDRPRSADK